MIVSVTLTCLSCDVLSTARFTVTLHYLTILRHILTMTLSATVDPKPAIGTHYKQIIHTPNSWKYSVEYTIYDILMVSLYIAMYLFVCASFKM